MNYSKALSVNADELLAALLSSRHDDRFQLARHFITYTALQQAKVRTYTGLTRLTLFGNAIRVNAVFTSGFC